MRIALILTFLICADAFAFSTWSCGDFQGLENNFSVIQTDSLRDDKLDLLSVLRTEDISAIDGLVGRKDLVSCHNHAPSDNFLEIMSKNNMSYNIMFALGFGIDGYYPGADYLSLLSNTTSASNFPINTVQYLCGKVNYLLLNNSHPGSIKVGLCNGNCDLSTPEKSFGSSTIFLNISDPSLLPAIIDSFVNGTEMQGTRTLGEGVFDDEVDDSLQTGCIQLTS